MVAKVILEQCFACWAVVAKVLWVVAKFDGSSLQIPVVLGLEHLR